LCGWYAFFGAGPIAIDTLLRRGLADSALPLMPRIVHGSEWVRSSCGPFFLSLMRVWLGAALLLAAMRPVWIPGDHTSRLYAWLPLGTAAQLPASFAVIGGALLPAFPETLSMSARRSLEKLGVEVLIGSPVERIDSVGVAVSGKTIVARTVLWAAGVKASPAAKWLRAGADNAGRVKVAADLSVPNLNNVYAIGDTAASNAWRGQALPGLAPAAKQGGKYAARQIRAKILGAAAPAAFAYRHLGSLATIGRKAAVADFGFIKLWGAPAWWLWGAVHLGFLLGIRNRLATMMNWFWSYLTLGGGIRLITGAEVPYVSPNDSAVDPLMTVTATDELNHRMQRTRERCSNKVESLDVLGNDLR
jgi:hypothetical protein